MVSEWLRQTWFYHTWFFHRKLGPRELFELEYINNNQWIPSLGFKKNLIFIPISWVITTFFEVILNPEWDRWLITITVVQFIELIWYMLCVFLIKRHTRATLIIYYGVLAFTQSIFPIMFAIKNVLCTRGDYSFITERTCGNTGQHELFYLYMYLGSFYSIVISEASIFLQSLVIIFLYLPSTIIGGFATTATKLQYFNTNLFLFGTYISIHGIGLVLYETKRKNYTLAIELESEMALRKKTVNYMFHELRNPLNVITLTIDETKDTQLRDTVTPCVVIMENILNDALDFEKIAQGSFELHPTNINFYDIIDQTISGAEPLWKAKRQQFTFNKDPTLGRELTSVIGDGMRIRQIVLNYLSNAVKYTDPEGHISMNMKKISEDDTTVIVKLEVKDSGVGISEENTRQLFQPFVQIANKMSATTRGTGLGLTIVASLTTQMGGTYGVDSELGAGSTFYCTIPFTKDMTGVQHTTTAQQTQSEMTIVDFSTLSPILLVDDNVMICNVIKAMLMRWNMEVDLAHNGVEALEKIRSGNYKVVLLDDQMPLKTGQEVLKELRDEGNNVTVISITGNVEAKETFLQIGANEVLIKPVHRIQLMDALRKFNGEIPTI